MRIEQLPLDEHRLLKRLAKVGPQRLDYGEASISLCEKGLAVLDAVNQKLTATDEGKRIGSQRVVRAA